MKFTSRLHLSYGSLEAQAMAAAMASKNNCSPSEAFLSRGLSRALLNREPSGLPYGPLVWQRYVRVYWKRRNPTAVAQVVKRVEVNSVVEGALFRASQSSRITGIVPGLDPGLQGIKMKKYALQPDRSFHRRAIFGEEYQVALACASSLSVAPSTASHPETSINGHEDDDRAEENQTVQYHKMAERSINSQRSSLLEHPNWYSPGSSQQWFPYDDCFKLNDEKTLTSSEVLSFLSPFLADERKQRIEEVVAHRTYSVCVVVEGLLDLGNISAVFRSADALGFQSVHVISNETKRKYKKNRKVSMGTEKWLDAEMWESTSECIATLRKRGYRIAVTHIAQDTVSIHDMDWTIPTAIVFGNEHKGASEEAIRQSDIRCCIPMVGMVESFNISVAAGILMHHAAHDRITRSGAHGDILPQDRKILEAEFCLRHNRHTVQILDRLVAKKENAVEGASLRDMFNDEFLSSVEEPEYLKQ